MSVRRENGPGPTLGINILTKEPNSSVGSQVRAAHTDAALHSGALPNVHMDMFRYQTVRARDRERPARTGPPSSYGDVTRASTLSPVCQALSSPVPVKAAFVNSLFRPGSWESPWLHSSLLRAQLLSPGPVYSAFLMTCRCVPFAFQMPPLWVVVHLKCSLFTDLW